MKTGIATGRLERHLRHENIIHEEQGNVTDRGGDEGRGNPPQHDTGQGVQLQVPTSLGESDADDRSHHRLGTGYGHQGEGGDEGKSTAAAAPSRRR